MTSRSYPIDAASANGYRSVVESILLVETVVVVDGAAAAAIAVAAALAVVVVVKVVSESAHKSSLRISKGSPWFKANAMGVEAVFIDVAGLVVVVVIVVVVAVRVPLVEQGHDTRAICGQ